MNYLLEYNGKAAFVEMLRGDSSDYYGQVQRSFLRQAGGESDRFAYVSMTRMDNPETVCGIPFSWELAGPGGASFELLAMPDTTAEQIAAAKDKLRRDRDVVRCFVRRIESLIPFKAPARESVQNPQQLTT